MIVLHAVMTYHRSIGTREAGSGNVWYFIGGPAGRLHGINVALSCQFEKGGSAGQIRGFDPRLSLKQLTAYYGLTREVTRISRIMTRPDPRDFENLLTRPDPTREIWKPRDPTRPDPRYFENLLTRPDPNREILKRNDSTRPDPRDFDTPLTQPAGWVMTREKPCIIAASVAPSRVVLVPPPSLAPPHHAALRTGNDNMSTSEEAGYSDRLRTSTCPNLDAHETKKGGSRSRWWPRSRPRDLRRGEPPE